ncbi:hypothetical protein Tco_0233099 [Tanacetum coccineum]
MTPHHQSLPLPKQDPSFLMRKRKAMELDPETYIAGLHYHRELPQGVKFVNNLVTDEPEHGLFFIDAFGDEAFQRVQYADEPNDKCIPDKDMILSKRVKLENLGYTDV